MTATTAGSTGPAPLARGPAALLRQSFVLTGRLLRIMPRTPELMIFSVVQPVMFVLLFRYVFGGAIPVAGGIPYVQFLMPGIFVQTLAFNGAATGIGMADDMAKGIVDRFRSLPISPAAMLIGRAQSDLIRSAVVLAVMIGVGVATGFRFQGSPGGVIAGLALVLGFSFAFSWIGIFIGLSVKSVEAAQSGGFIWLFPLTFASSAFVPTASMPGWLRAFADVNPVTVVVNSCRALLDPAAGAALQVHLAADVWQSLAWIVAVIAVFVPLGVSRFRRMAR